MGIQASLVFRQDELAGFVIQLLWEKGWCGAWTDVWVSDSVVSALIHESIALYQGFNYSRGSYLHVSPVETFATGIKMETSDQLFLFVFLRTDKELICDCVSLLASLQITCNIDTGLISMLLGSWLAPWDSVIKLDSVPFILLISARNSTVITHPVCLFHRQEWLQL